MPASEIIEKIAAVFPLETVGAARTSSPPRVGAISTGRATSASSRA